MGEHSSTQQNEKLCICKRRQGGKIETGNFSKAGRVLLCLFAASPFNRSPKEREGEMTLPLLVKERKDRSLKGLPPTRLLCTPALHSCPSEWSEYSGQLVPKQRHDSQRAAPWQPDRPLVPLWRLLNIRPLFDMIFWWWVMDLISEFRQPQKLVLEKLTCHLTAAPV